MDYSEINKLMKTIPREHRKTVRKLCNAYRDIGAMKVLELVKSLSEIPPDQVDSYGVWHDSEIDGG